MDSNYKPCQLNRRQIKALREKLIIAERGNLQAKFSHEELHYLIAKIHSHIALRDSIYTCNPKL